MNTPNLSPNKAYKTYEAETITAGQTPLSFKQWLNQVYNKQHVNNMFANAGGRTIDDTTAKDVVLITNKPENNTEPTKTILGMPLNIGIPVVILGVAAASYGLVKLYQWNKARKGVS